MSYYPGPQRDQDDYEALQEYLARQQAADDEDDTPQICPNCNGTGARYAERPGAMRCLVCGGSGELHRR